MTIRGTQHIIRSGMRHKHYHRVVVQKSAVNKHVQTFEAMRTKQKYAQIKQKRVLHGKTTF